MTLEAIHGGFIGAMIGGGLASTLSYGWPLEIAIANAIVMGILAIVLNVGYIGVQRVIG